MTSQRHSLAHAPGTRFGRLGRATVVLPESTLITPKLHCSLVNPTLRAVLAASGQPTLTPEFKQAIDDFLAENKVVAFIKGTKEFPMCGFSNTVVQILNGTGVPYTTVNVLDSDLIRSGDARGGAS